MPTKQIRVYEPTAKKLAVIANERSEDIAEVAERLLQSVLEAEYERALESLGNLRTRKKPAAK